MDEKRYRVRLGDHHQHSGIPLTKAEAEETAAWSRRFRIQVQIIEDRPMPLPADRRRIQKVTQIAR
jgi:hypothetical protein